MYQLKINIHKVKGSTDLFPEIDDLFYTALELTLESEFIQKTQHLNQWMNFENAEVTINSKYGEPTYEIENCSNELKGKISDAIKSPNQYFNFETWAFSSTENEKVFSIDREGSFTLIDIYLIRNSSDEKDDEVYIEVHGKETSDDYTINCVVSDSLHGNKPSSKIKVDKTYMRTDPYQIHFLPCKVKVSGLQGESMLAISYSIEDYSML